MDGARTKVAGPVSRFKHGLATRLDQHRGWLDGMYIVVKWIGGREAWTRCPTWWMRAYVT